LPQSGGSKDDPTKRLYENALKALEDNVTKEKDLYASRNKFLDVYNAQNLVSTSDYYNSRQAILDAAVNGEKKAIDDEIALATARKNAPSTSAKDAAEAQGQIEKLVRRRADLEQKAGEEGITLSIERKKAEDDFQNTLKGVNAQVLDLTENFAAAAAIKFDLQNDALSKMFTAQGNTDGLAALATLRANTIAQAAFQKATLDSGRTLDLLNAKEDRIALAVQTGSLTTLGALAAEGEARRALIPLIEAQVEADEAIAKGPGGTPDLVKKAEASRLALDKLKASADPLAASLNKLFGDDFNSSLDDFVTGTKSASEAFSSFTKSVLNDILKMGSKSITEAIFGGSGGIGGLISGASGGSASGGLLGGLAGLFKGGDATSGSGSAGGIAGSAADAGGASNTVGVFASIAKLFGGFFADGGAPPLNKVSVVGENGPELFVPSGAGRVVPNSGGGNSRIQHNYFTVQQAAGASKESANQLAATIARKLAVADRRNK
jgi:hypothetical protein